MEGVVSPSASFWLGKRVFLTGHTGFKGGWLALWLKRLGADVTGFALPPDTNPSLFDLADIKSQLCSIEGDIRDKVAIADAMKQAAPDIILHLAAQPLVHRSFVEPLLTFETNVLGTAYVLEAARQISSVRAIVVVTSDKCYENREWVWAYRENDPIGGHDPYSASKACTEIVTASWRRSFFSTGNSRESVAIASARAGNVIGGGDWAADRLIPDCVRALSQGRDVQIRNPQATRPWQHVLEPLCGYLLLAENLWRSGSEHSCAWNFGPLIGADETVAQVVDRFVAGWGDGAAWSQLPGYQPHETHMLAVDSSLARMRMKWRPRWTLPTAITRTVDWYKQQLAGGHAAKLVEADISHYERCQGAV